LVASAKNKNQAIDKRRQNIKLIKFVLFNQFNSEYLSFASEHSIIGTEFAHWKIIKSFRYQHAGQN